jgi:hypothetical protein
MSYRVTPRLSVDAPQLMVAPVCPTFDTAG